MLITKFHTVKNWLEEIIELSNPIYKKKVIVEAKIKLE